MLEKILGSFLLMCMIFIFVISFIVSIQNLEELDFYLREELDNEKKNV